MFNGCSSWGEVRLSDERGLRQCSRKTAHIGSKIQIGGEGMTDFI